MADGIAPPAVVGAGNSAISPDDFMTVLGKLGIDPNLPLDQVMTPDLQERVFMAAGRERARPRYQKALERAQQYGYDELRQRIEALVEADAERHARRGMRRSGGIGSDAVAAPSPAAQAPAAGSARPPVMAPPLPVPGAASQPLGINYGAPQFSPVTAMPPPDQYGRPGLRPSSGVAAGPQSAQEAQNIASEPNVYNALIEASGMGPAGRSRQAFAEGRPWEGIGHASIAALPYRPAAGLAGLGAAYGGALAETLMPSATSPAQAQQPAASDATVLQSLLDRQGVLQNEANEARIRRETERQTGTGPKFTAADEAYKQAQARLDAISRQIEALNKRMSPEALQQQREYASSVETAERGLAEARSRRVRPFKETPVGSLYEATGGWTPAVVGAATGGILRAAGHSPRRAITGGAIGGAVTPNAPLVWDILSQPVANPERETYAAYARDLPPTHPRRAEWQAYAERQPEENPVRSMAVRDFYDPWKIAERHAIGAVEGGVGGEFGSAVVDAARRLGSSARSGLENMLGRRQGTGAQGTGETSGGAATPPNLLATLGATQRRPLPPVETPPPVPTGRPLPTLAERRRDRSYSIPRDAPVAPGEVETWVSPAGNKVITRDASGNLRDGNRWIGREPPKGYRRIAEAEQANLLAAYG